MKRMFVLAFSAFFGLTGACLTGASDEGQGALFHGLRSDDDGCPWAAGCPKAAPDGEGATEPPGARQADAGPGEGEDLSCPPYLCPDPWPATDGPGEAEIVVGTNDLQNPSCSGSSSVVTRTADAVAWYVRGDTGVVCSAVLLTNDNKLSVPLACLSATAQLGTAYFGVYPTHPGCRPQGAASVGDPYPAILEGVFINFLEELAIVQLGPRASDGTFATQNHTLIKLGQPSTWGLGNGLLTTDSLVYAGAQSNYTLADPACNRVNAPLSGGLGRTDCDTDAPPPPNTVDHGFGGPIVYGDNGCVPAGPGGACAPGTGPQSPGALPGRLVGLMHRPSGASPVNDMKYLSMARLTSPTGFLTQSGVLTPGNYDP